MLTVKIYNDIFSCPKGGVSQAPFSAEGVKDLLAANPNESDVRFDIHCNGGSVREGFAIYDILRTSGRNIYCNIDGGCHSMAIILLLAAPKENRSANPSSVALIHDVRTWAGEVTADSARSLSDDLQRERNRILDVYHERTGYNRQTLETIMLEEKERTAEELLSWGFISKVNGYTNKKTNTNQTMQRKQTLFSRLNSYLRRELLNYDFTDAEGTLLFSTENEDDSLAVGDPASPDGTFDLADGRTVTIADGVISEITDPAAAPANRALQEQVNALNTRLREAHNLLREAQREMQQLSGVRSTANIKPRQGTSGSASRSRDNALSSEERKAQVRKNLGKTEKQ